jgi:hypothetical protein
MRKLGIADPEIILIVIQLNSKQWAALGRDLRRDSEIFGLVRHVG